MDDKDESETKKELEVFFKSYNAVLQKKLFEDHILKDRRSPAKNIFMIN